MPPKRKAATLTKDFSETQVLQYLESQYRPYSANDIFQNLHGAIGKTAVTKALESLSKQGRIHTKTFGKMTVSVANQIVVKVESTKKNHSEDENFNYNEVLANLENELEIVNKEINDLQQELSDITQHTDDKTSEKEFKRLEEEVDALEKRLKDNESKMPLSPVAITEFKSISVEITEEFENRKKMYKNFKNFLSEYIEPKKLIDQLGLDEPEGKI